MLVTALQGLSTGWEQQHGHLPALGVPWDTRQGTATLFPSQVFVCRQEGLFDLTVMGKAAVFRCIWKVPALAVALIRRAVALKAKGRGPRGPRVFGGGGTPQWVTAQAWSS